MFYSTLPFPPSPPSRSLSKNYVQTKKHFEQHERSLAQLTHIRAHTRIKSQTHAKRGRGKPECWNRTLCYSKNTFEGTCGWEHTEQFPFFFFTHICGCTQTRGNTAGMWTHAVTQQHTHTHTCLKHTHVYMQSRTSWTWLGLACKVMWQFLRAQRGLSGCCFSYSGFVA